jgi:hypothetical protein
VRTKAICRTCGALVLVATLALAAAALAAGRDPDGAYEGKGTNVGNLELDQVDIEFDVAGNGSKVKSWVVRMNAICAVFPGPVELQFVTQPMPGMKIKKDGRFRGIFKREIDDEPAEIEVTGRLKGTKVKQGTLSYRVGACYRGEEVPVRWEATRTRP